MTLSPKDRSRGRFWAFFIPGLLGAMMAGLIVMVVIAVDDPSFSLEPDFYKKGVAYDAEMAQAERNVALGWKTEVAELGAGRLVVKLADRAGAAIDDAKIDVVAFPVARGRELRRISLAAEKAGRYAGGIGPTRAGLWEVRLSVDARGEHFTSVLREELAAPKGATP